jgi:hypothetical protein
VCLLMRARVNEREARGKNRMYVKKIEQEKVRGRWRVCMCMCNREKKREIVGKSERSRTREREMYRVCEKR